ncbi:MAG TPA: alkaline phosphatase family protein [Hyphomonadaceae bacterium]|nr:alkaline phosphatase family protein [Hyphomonadaceae bacterium]
MRRILVGLGLALATLAACQQMGPAAGPAPAPFGQRNAIIFVGDGLRYASVNPQDGPALYALKTEGVDFANSHSLFPTITTVNASAIATGHYIGDTGDFGNALLNEKGQIVQLEDDSVLRAMNASYGGNYLNERSLLAAARAKGFQTAVIGKTGPAAIQDVTQVGGGGPGIIVDEATGRMRDGQPAGVTLPPDIQQAIAAAGIPPSPPGRTSGKASIGQVDWLARVATEAVIPQFKKNNRPFVMLFWSPDPDITQHGQSDGRGTLQPGINGPSSKEAIHNASNALQRIRDALKAQGLDQTTDIFVTADHGFSTVTRDGAMSSSLALPYTKPQGVQMPTGFAAIDMAKALNLPLWKADGTPWPMSGPQPTSANGLIGADPKTPQMVIVANGGAELIYLPDPATRKEMAGKVVAHLAQQDYTGAIFVDEGKYGKLPGALGLADVRLVGSAKTVRPDIFISYRTHLDGCETELCSILVTDSGYEVGQGTHGSLGRGETRNFMAAIGPDFKEKFVNTAPISNADIAPTLAHILGIDLGGVGKLKGRVITEALKGGSDVKPTSETKKATPAANGFATILNLQKVGDAEYFDAAGSEGRAVGVKP